MKITESKLREIIRSVIREASSGGGGGSSAQDDIAKQEPKVDTSLKLGDKYWYDDGGSSGQHGEPAKYYIPDWGGSGLSAYATDPSAKKKSSSPWETNPDYRDWEQKMADAKQQDTQSGGAAGKDQPTGGGTSTGGRRGKKKGKKKKDEE